ncbi:MAG: indole-3-glycerol phosphate synthase TrpC [Candidatus Zixiibacteriota bacterium]
MQPSFDHKPIPAILKTLVESSRQRVTSLRSQTSFDDLLKRAHSRTHRPFRAALKNADPAIIAEIKMASPSKGTFSNRLDPESQASAYARGGCAAISVVTEPKHFLGDLRWIEVIRAAVPVPVLRKDFIIDPIQVAESAVAGADAILLIARILTEEQLVWLTDTAHDCGLEILYEAHDEVDIEKIRMVDPQLVGVNARDLDTFVVDIDRVKRLRALLPSTSLLVAESGIERREQIVELGAAGYQAFLVGESLLRSDHPERLLRTLRGAE